MKTMILLLAIITLISCENPTIENSVEDPDTITTVELQKLKKHHAVIAFGEKGRIYHFNKKNQIVMVTSLRNRYTVVLSVMDVFFILMIATLIGVLVGFNLCAGIDDEE